MDSSPYTCGTWTSVEPLEHGVHALEVGSLVPEVELSAERGREVRDHGRDVDHFREGAPTRCLAGELLKQA